MNQDQPLLCPLLNQFDDFFGNKRMKHSVVSQHFKVIYRLANGNISYFLRQMMLTTPKMVINAKTNVIGIVI